MKKQLLRDGKILVKCSSHRARDKMNRLLGYCPQSYYSLHRDAQKGLYEIPPEQLDSVLKIKGVSRSYWSDDLSRTISFG